MYELVPATRCVVECMDLTVWPNHLRRLALDECTTPQRHPTEPPSLPQEVLSSLRVALGTQSAVFSAAVCSRNEISVSGTVKAGAPYLTRIGSFDVDLQLGGIVLLVRQVRPCFRCMQAAVDWGTSAHEPSRGEDINLLERKSWQALQV